MVLVSRLLLVAAALPADSCGLPSSHPVCRAIPADSTFLPNQTGCDRACLTGFDSG